MKTSPAIARKRLRRTLPQLAEGSLLIDLFTEVHFDSTGVWLLTPEGVYRAFRAAGKWSRWKKRPISRQQFLDWPCV